MQKIIQTIRNMLNEMLTCKKNMADKKDPQIFTLVSKDSFEAVYNERVYNRELSHSQALGYTKGKQWASALLAVLALLPDVQLDKKTGSLKYR